MIIGSWNDLKKLAKEKIEETEDLPNLQNVLEELSKVAKAYQNSVFNPSSGNFPLEIDWQPKQTQVIFIHGSL